MSKYHTEGIVKDVKLTQTDGTFTLEASAPFSIAEKTSTGDEKSILFVADDKSAPNLGFDQPDLEPEEPGNPDSSKNPKPLCRDAFLVAESATFSFKTGGPIDTATLLLLKQNRTKIRMTIEGTRGAAPSKTKEPVFVVSELIIK